MPFYCKIFALAPPPEKFLGMPIPKTARYQTAFYLLLILPLSPDTSRRHIVLEEILLQFYLFIGLCYDVMCFINALKNYIIIKNELSVKNPFD